MGRGELGTLDDHLVPQAAETMADVSFATDGAQPACRFASSQHDGVVVGGYVFQHGVGPEHVVHDGVIARQLLSYQFGFLAALSSRRSAAVASSLISWCLELT